VPLHSSPAGKKYGKTFCGMNNTIEAGYNQLRLPIHNYITEDQIRKVCKVIYKMKHNFQIG
jgi:dTDP-4-amino-4,6-dideoxygalactose transaminase